MKTNTFRNASYNTYKIGPAKMMFFLTLASKYQVVLLEINKEPFHPNICHAPNDRLHRGRSVSVGGFSEVK